MTATSTLSKKRYESLTRELVEELGDEAVVERVLAVLRRVMGFDPKATQYTKEKGQRMIEQRREKAKALGVTTYVTSGRKKQYEKQKALA